MNLALDYDGTYTADPVLWNAFVKNAVERGHNVYVITMRKDDQLDEVRKNLQHLVTDIVNTSHKGKKPFVENIGLDIDVWIDDVPEYLLHDA